MKERGAWYAPLDYSLIQFVSLHTRMPVLSVCTAEQVDASQTAEATNEVQVEDDVGQGTADDADKRSVEESQFDSMVTNDTNSPRASLQSAGSQQSQTAAAVGDVEDVEVSRADEETPKLSEVKDGDEGLTETTPTKPDQTSTKTGNSRTTTGSKCGDKKIWKPAGTVGVLPTQQNRKEARAMGTSSRGKPQRQGNGSVPTRLPPISVSGVGSSDRKRQQATAGEMARGASNGLTAGRGAGVNATPPGRLYKCSATACVTVLSQPPETAQQASANGDELSSWSDDFSNRNRKYYSSTTTRMNGDPLPLVVADNKHLTSEVSIVRGDSLRIVVDGFQVPRRRDVTSGESTDPVSVRIDVAMTTGGGGGRMAGGGRRQRAPQHPLLLARHQLSPANRDVISTRAIGPPFHHR